MKLRSAQHLTYCLNVHPGESWAENFAAIREKAVAVRDLVAPGQPFGLGLRLSRQAASELSKPAQHEQARAFFTANNLYAFTINGFPFGRFHDRRVKEQVYAPDWRSDERLDYTIALAEILAELLPEGLDGSISTVPGSYKPWIKTEADVRAMGDRLIACAQRLAQIKSETGKEIHLGLEPEPSCFLETTGETIEFFDEVLFRRAGADAELVRKHIGVCFDTCHVALQFEDLCESFERYRAAGIRISKVQLSKALAATPGPDALRELSAFDEPVYLHQVKARSANGSIRSWEDLGTALPDLEKSDASEVRVHFHVPLFFNGSGPLGATEIDRDFLHKLNGEPSLHLEIETYTWSVLPEEIRLPSVVESVAREYRWMLERLI